MTSKMKRTIFLLLNFFIILAAFPLQAKEKENILNLDVEGNAKITQNDVAGARDEAIQDALDKAISQSASFLLSIPVDDEKFQTIKNALKEDTQKYVSDYKITGESRQPDSYSVNVSVSVVLADLKSDLAKMGFLKEPDKEKASLVVFLKVSGIRRYAEFSYLRQFLQQRAQIVKGIHTFSFEWQQAGLELEITGSAKALADELGSTGKYMLDTGMIDRNQLEVTYLYDRGGSNE